MEQSYLYRVFPEPPGQTTLSDEERRTAPGLKSPGCTGCLLWFVLYVVLGTFWGVSWSYLGLDDRWGWTMMPLAYIVAPALAFTATYLISRHKRAHNVAQIERQRAENELRSKEEEANQLTSWANGLLVKSVALAQQMPALLDNAVGWLGHAENEFADNAFSPFWDAIEKATVALARFGEVAEELRGNAQQYNDILRNRKHDFPPLPIRPHEIPDPAPAVGELRRLVRMGQTNIDFAHIWEHHKTRNVLVLGFGTLGESIEGIGAEVLGRLEVLQDLLR